MQFYSGKIVNYIAGYKQPLHNLRLEGFARLIIMSIDDRILQDTNSINSSNKAFVQSSNRHVEVAVHCSTQRFHSGGKKHGIKCSGGEGGEIL